MTEMKRATVVCPACFGIGVSHGLWLDKGVVAALHVARCRLCQGMRRLGMDQRGVGPDYAGAITGGNDEGDDDPK